MPRACSGLAAMESALHIRDLSSHSGAGVLVAGLRVSLVLYTV